MRKLFVLSLLLLSAIASESQIPPYYNHIPTAGGNSFPFNINAATGKKVQWIVAAGEFNQPTPVSAGNNITNLWFLANSMGNATYTTLTVRMANVPTSTYFSIGAWYAGPMTTVLAQNTTIAPSAAQTWVNIPLTTTFLYDPTMHLIIEVSQCGFSGTGFGLNQIGLGAAPNYRRQYSDATSACGVTVLATGGDLNVPGIGITVVPAAPCSTPTAQPTGLILTAASVSQINGSFTAAAGAPTNYLVVRYPSGASPTNPVDGTTYTVGGSLGTGTVISTNSSTSFNATGLSPSTTYDFYVYSFNSGACSNAYRIVSPLSGSQTTLSCTPLAGGTYTVGPTGTYTTLTAATAAIAGGTSGPVIFELQSTYTSAGETFPIIFTTGGCPITGGLTVRPAVGASGLQITSANTTTTIDINNISNVTIDGRPGGIGVTSQLTIANTSAAAASSAVRFINDAVNSTVTYCSLQGSTTTLGVVSFGTGVTTGNDGNTISNNNIGPSGANLPLNGIYSLGTSVAIDNSGNTITANNIFDYFNATTATSGININTNNSAWTITNNRLYQTATRLYTTGVAHRGINITTGSGYTITGNIIGYANNTGTGTTNMVGNSVPLTGTFPSSYTVTGTANATTYIGISCAFTAAGTMSEIQNNTIAGFALYTSSSTATTTGILCGIGVTSGNVNIGTTTGNTIGATSGNSSIYTCATVTGGIIAGIYVTSANAIAIRNNTIGALDAMGTTATISGGINGINIAGASTSYDVSGNTIGNSTNPSLRMGNLTTGANLSNIGTTFGVATGTGQFNGILSTATTAGTIGTQALPNIIRNASLNSSATAASIRGITASGIATISYNSINNITSQTTNIAVGSTLLAGMGIFLNSISTVGAVVNNNTINSLSLTNTTATGTNITGIAIYAGSSNLFANKIYDITNASTSVATATPGTASGFFLRQPAGTINIYNNMVSLGNGQTTNTSFNGIWQQNSVVAYTLNAYFNTFNIEGTVAAGAQPSFGLNRGSYSATQVLTPVSIVDNIFTNTRSGGTGKHYAIANNYLAAASATGWGANASNFNALNAAAATVGYWGADQTFAGWKTASSCDGSSISGVTVNYVNTATGDLHLNMGVTPTQLESGGTAAGGIVTDYDNQTRPGPPGSGNGGGFAPDLGADEFDGVFLDASGPAITYTLLPNTLCASNVNLTATITDPSGVNVAVGTKPRVYYKKSTNANTFVDNTNGTDGWKFAEATNASSPFSFTLNLSLVNGGVAAGDVIQYFVVAQDLLAIPNVGINSGIFAVQPTSVALTAAAFPLTGTINSYTIGTGGLSGTKTIGAAGDYTSLTGAGGLFSVLNAGGLTGNLTVNILDASVTETGATALNQISYGCGGPFTLTIKPNAAVTSTLTGTLASNALIRILSKNVVIDGSNNGTSSRDLTLTNLSTTAPSVVLIGSSGINATNNVTLKNCIVINGAQTATAVVVSDATLGTAGYFNNITIQNNSIQKAYIGVYSISVVAAGNGSGLLVTGNDLNTAGANSIRLVGLYCQGVDGATYSNNNISNIANTLDATNITGIWLATGVANSTISGNNISVLSGTAGSPRGIAISPGTTGANNINVSGNTITNITSSSTATTSGIYLFTATGGVRIQRNNISNIKNTNASGFGCNGIQLESTLTTSVADVFNNYISDVAGFGFNGTGVGDNGYGIIITSGGGYNLYYNTVVMNTNQTLATGLPSALNVTSGVTAASSLNIRDNIFVNTQTIGTNRYCVFSGATSAVYADINYNDYYFTGPNLGNIGGTDRANLAAWQTGTGKDAQSRSVQPIFVSATDFHLRNLAGDNWCLNGTGQTIATFTTDYDGDTRGTPPDIGADEFVAVGDAVATPASQTVCSGTAITTIALSGTATSYNWTRDNTGTVTGIAASGTGNISGTLTNTTSAPVTVTFTITPVNAGGCFGPTITATVLVNPTPNAVATPLSQSSCTGTPITTIVLSGAVSGTTFNWTRDNTVTVTGIANSGSGNISGTLTNTTAAPVTVTFTITPTANGCPGTPTTATVTVNPLPVLSGVLTQPTTCVSTNGGIDLTVSGTPGPYTYFWTTVGGSGIVQGVQDQTTLTVGQYTVLVTDANGCQQTAVFTLTGPGGCAICPTIGSVTASPSPGCTGATVTLTASGLTSMGVTYGITFKYSLVALPDPYVGGTVIGTVANGSLTGGGTIATLNTSFAVSGNYIIYAILSPTPVDPSCRPSGTTLLTVNPTPNATIVTTPGVLQVIITGNGSWCDEITWTLRNNLNAIILSGGPYGFNPGPTPSGTVPAANAPFTFFIEAQGTFNDNSCLWEVRCDGNVVASGCIRGTANPSVCANIGTLTVPNISGCGASANQTICSGATIMPIQFSGTVPGTVFNWTRNNTVTVTGTIGASGTGTISGTLINTTTAPVLVTFTITPVANGCSGTPITATVLVNPSPNAVATPSSQTICSGASITPIVLTGAVVGTTYNWVRNNTATVTGIAANGTGNINGILTNITAAPVTVTFTITPVANGCPGTATTATVLVNPTPTVNQGGIQVTIRGDGVSWADEITWTLRNSLNAIILSGGPYGFNPPPTPSATVAASNAPFTFFIEAQGVFNDNSCLWEVRCDGNLVSSGCIKGTANTGSCPSIGTLTVNNISGCGPLLPQTVCSGSAITPIVLGGPVAGTVFNWTRDNTVTVTGIPASGTGTISGTLTNTTNAPILVTFTITPSANGCTGPVATATVLVNPIPNAVAAPTTQTVCSGAPITPIVFTGNVSGTTYNWTRNNTVNVTGMAASGTGNISGTLNNATGVQQTVIFTITPVANGCTGTPITATVIVQAALTITCPANITVPSVVGTCTAVVTYTPVITGTPVPTVTYSFSGATTGSGNGTGSGSTFNVGVTTVSITATNSCGTVNCSFTITVTDSQLPVISQQPSNQTVCAGSNALFNVVSTNAQSYQWQAWNGAAWVNIAGANASTLTLNSVTFSMNTNSYRVIVIGLCTNITSGFATLFVNALPTVSILASGPLALLPAQSVTLTAVVSPGGGSYQWFKNGVAIPGATGASLVGLTVSDIGTYRVMYTDLNGCVRTSADMVVSGQVSDGLFIYPVPNDGHFHVRFYNQANEKVTVRVFDTRGALVYLKEAITVLPYTDIDIDMRNRITATAAYVVEVRGGDGRLIGSKKIIIYK